MIITPSMLKHHAQCPFSFKLKYIDGLVPTVKKSSEVLGNYLHLTIQKFLKNEIQNPEGYFVSLWDEVKEFLVYPEGEDGEKLKEIALKILGQIPEFVKTLGEIVEVEQPYEADLPVGLLRGTPDLIVVQNGGVVLDWKITRSVIEGKERIDPQLRMYGYLTGVPRGGYIYIKRTKNPTIELSPIVDITPREEEIMLWAEQSVLMEEGPFYKNVSFFCQMCEYLPLCCGEEGAEDLYEKAPVVDRYAGVECKRVRV